MNYESWFLVGWEQEPSGKKLEKDSTFLLWFDVTKSFKASVHFDQLSLSLWLRNIISPEIIPEL